MVLRALWHTKKENSNGFTVAIFLYYNIINVILLLNGMAVAARPAYAQQVRLLRSENREGARHDGRQGGGQEVLSDESEDLRAQVCHGLFLGLLQRYGKQERDGLADYREYVTERATVDELKAQNSYFIRALYGA